MKSIVFLCLAVISAVIASPYKCGPNEVVRHCKCKPNSFCPSNCPPSCDCIDGYVRNKYGDCRKATSYTSTGSCEPTEYFSNCGSVCERTCDDPYADTKPCVLICKSGCFCKNGYVRDSSGKCIIIQNCPRLSYNQRY